MQASQLFAHTLCGHLWLEGLSTWVQLYDTTMRFDNMIMNADFQGWIRFLWFWCIFQIITWIYKGKKNVLPSKISPVYRNKVTCLWELDGGLCRLVQPLWKTVWRFLKKLEIELPYDPAIPLLGIHTKETRFKETHAPQCSSQHCLS